MPKKKNFDDSLTIRLTPTQVLQLEYLSKALGKSKAALLREANDDILKKYASISPER